MVSIEYLIAFNVEAGLCKSLNAFKSLLKSNERISIKRAKISFEGIAFPLKIHHGDIGNGKLKYFHLIIQSEEEDVKILRSLCEEIRKIVSKVCEGNQVQTLWDGIGFKLCKDAYPVIYEVENLLRKLITKFMLCNVGLSWHKESVPAEVRDSIKNKSDKNTVNCLYEADFIQLANFLFKPYSSKDIGGLFSKLENLDSDDALCHADFEEYIPKSNWDRFFSDVVSCEKGFIEKRWERLYELRCMIAHNKQFSFEDYDEVIKIANELRPKFVEAIDNLEKVEVPVEEKEKVAESIAISRSSSYEKFLKNMDNISSSIAHISNIKLPDIYVDSADRMRLISNDLLERSLINESVMKDLDRMEKLRNSLVHNINIKIPDSILDSRIHYLDSLKYDIENKLNFSEEDEVHEDGAENEDVDDGKKS